MSYRQQFSCATRMVGGEVLPGFGMPVAELFPD